MADHYWTYIREDSKIFDAEFKTMDEARTDAENQFVQECVDNEVCASTEQSLELLKYVYDENEEPVEDEKHDATIEFMFDPTSDFQEHSVWH